MIATKLFVVILVITAVFIGLAVYLFMIDRKTSKLEKEINERLKK